MSNHAFRARSSASAPPINRRASAHRDLVAAAAAKLPPELAAALQRDMDTPATVRLAQLSVSPDGKCLAAVATLFRGGVGFAGRPFGVLIPLDRSKHTARPFAKNVYGKILWSSDAKALYYYAQPQAGTGIGANLAAAAFAALAMLVVLRRGLLALVVSFAAAFGLNGMPTTLRASEWCMRSSRRRPPDSTRDGADTAGAQVLVYEPRSSAAPAATAAAKAAKAANHGSCSPRSS